jgi:hypothetical protein
MTNYGLLDILTWFQKVAVLFQPNDKWLPSYVRDPNKGKTPKGREDAYAEGSEDAAPPPYPANSPTYDNDAFDHTQL